MDLTSLDDIIFSLQITFFAIARCNESGLSYQFFGIKGRIFHNGPSDLIK